MSDHAHKAVPSESKDSIQHLAAGSALGRQDLDDPPLLHEGGPVRAAQRHLVILLGSSTATPDAFSVRIKFVSSWTTTGARPSVGSSSKIAPGLDINARPTASI